MDHFGDYKYIVTHDHKRKARVKEEDTCVEGVGTFIFFDERSK
jgi:hypothetical protein